MPRKSSKDLLHQHWVHSHEEDTDAEMVFRPASYPFPPSRGRRSFELKPGGSLVEVGIGPTDRRQLAAGKWRLQKGNHIAFYAQSESVPSRVMQIASLEKDRLTVRKAPAARK